MDEENVRAAALPPLTAEATRAVQEVYDRLIRPQVHWLWYALVSGPPPGTERACADTARACSRGPASLSQ